MVLGGGAPICGVAYMVTRMEDDDISHGYVAWIRQKFLQNHTQTFENYYNYKKNTSRIE